MKAKDIKIGQPYLFETKYRHYSTEGDGAVYVLSKKTWRESDRLRQIGSPFVLYNGMKSSGERTGLLVVKCRWGLNDRQRAVLDKLTFEEIASAGMKIPNYVYEAIKPSDGSYGTSGIELDVIQARYIVGEWDEIVGARKAQRQRENEAREQEKIEAGLRVERWEAVADALKEITGTSLYVSSYGEETEKEIRLEDMEKLIELAQRARSLENLIDTTEGVDELPGMDPL